jgi:crossover junction endodeoxyribonuclease RuvC
MTEERGLWPVGETVMGIDPGNGVTAMALIRTLTNEPGKLIYNNAIKSNQTGPARWIEIEDGITGLLRGDLKPDLICIENYGFNSNTGNAQAELGGVLRRRFYKEGIEYIVVAPSQLKKFVQAKEKEFIIKEVFKRWEMEFDTHDETDAFVLAKIAEAIMMVRTDPAASLPKYQMEVVNALINPAPKKKKSRKKKGMANEEEA